MNLISSMFYRKPRSYKGLDCSEAETKVLPPTFAGVKSLVAKLGSEAAVLSAFPVHSLDGPEGELFQDFLIEFQSADKVERETLFAGFKDYLDRLKQSKVSSSPAPGAPAAAAPAAATDPQQTNDDKAATTQE